LEAEKRANEREKEMHVYSTKTNDSPRNRWLGPSSNQDPHYSSYQPGPVFMDPSSSLPANHYPDDNHIYPHNLSDRYESNPSYAKSSMAYNSPQLPCKSANIIEENDKPLLVLTAIYPTLQSS
jgi:hypothetical protein